MDDAKFYGLMERKRKEIAGFKMSEEEKNRLYALIDETIGRYEEGKAYCQKRVDAVRQGEEALEKMFNSFRRSSNLIKKTQENVERLSEAATELQINEIMNSGERNFHIIN